MIKLGKARGKRFALGMITIILFALLLSSNTVNAQTGFIQIISVDSYEKSVRAGENATYNWTIANFDSGMNFTVKIQSTISGTGWSSEVVPEEIILAQDELNSTTVTVFAPTLKGDTSANLTVSFYVYKDEILVQVISANAATIITGAFASAEKVLGLFDNPLPAPLDNEWGVFLLDIIIWLLVALIIAFLIGAFGSFLARRSSALLKKTERIIIQIIKMPLLLIIFAFGVVQSLDALHMHIPEDTRQLIGSGYHVIVVIVTFYLVYRVFKNVLTFYSETIAKRTATKLDDILVPVVEKVGIFVLGIAAFLYVLGALKVDLTMFVAGGVFISFVVAFAAQETLSNFFSGIFILLDQPFSEGDIVILSDGDWCEVRKIGLRTTKLFRYSDASMVAIPNNKLVNDKIANFTSVPDKGRVMMTFGVSYDSDADKVKKIIREVINDCPWIITDDPNLKPIVRFDEMADSSINFFILTWLNERADRFNTKDFLNTNIFKRFNEEGIEIPFPQRVVHLKKEEQ